MFIKSLCGEAREKILSFRFTFEMCSRACNIRRRGLIVLYRKEISACAERSDQEEIWQRCFFCFFLLSSRILTSVPYLLSVSPSRRSQSLVVSRARARAHSLFFSAMQQEKINRTWAYDWEIRWIVIGVGNGTVARDRGEFEERRCYNSMGPVQVLVKFATSST